MWCACGLLRLGHRPRNDGAQPVFAAAILDCPAVRQRYADTLLDCLPGFPWLVQAAWAGLAATGALIFRGHDFLQGY